MSKNSSAKYYQDKKKERLQEKTSERYFSKEGKEKNTTICS